RSCSYASCGRCTDRAAMICAVSKRGGTLCADVAAVADSNYLFAMGHEELVMVIRVFGALVIGGLIGFERTFHGRPAGFRAYSVGCAARPLLMLVTVYQSQWMPETPLDAIRTDPTRMAQGIMTGIGFLGAGVIFKEGLTVRGLTTAASIWITAAIGILV